MSILKWQNDVPFQQYVEINVNLIKIFKIFY